MKRSEIFALIISERQRQDAKWGPQASHTPEKWYAILGEEFGEVAKEVLERPNSAKMRAELIQVAAVCVKWLELGRA